MISLAAKSKFPAAPSRAWSCSTMAQGASQLDAQLDQATVDRLFVMY